MIQKELWFPTPVWYGQLPITFGKDFYVDTVNYYQNISKTEKGVQMSNEGGWQSDHYKLHEIKPFMLNQALDYIFQQSLQIPNDLGLYGGTLNFGRSWVNLNPKNSFNHPHFHVGVTLVAVLFLTDSKSKLTFHRGDELAEWNLRTLRSVGNTELSFSTCEYNCLKGNFVIFPSWVKHSVEINRTEEDRLSAAFDMIYS